MNITQFPKKGKKIIATLRFYCFAHVLFPFICTFCKR
nr:MAG TPA_asm: hypothetical protein [Caudoviricetes sp.]